MNKNRKIQLPGNFSELDRFKQAVTLILGDLPLKFLRLLSFLYVYVKFSPTCLKKLSNLLLEEFERSLYMYSNRKTSLYPDNAISKYRPFRFNTLNMSCWN